MRNGKPPKRPAGMTPKMEKDLREQMASNTAAMRDPSIKSVNPTFGGMAGRAVASAYMRGKASDNRKIDDMVKDLATTVKMIRSEGSSGIRGAVTPINSKQIADMARRYAQKEKSVLPEIKNLTSRQKQMVRDEIARQYKKPTMADKAKDVVDKAKVMAKKVNKKMPSITAVSIAAQNPNSQTTNLNEVIVKPKTYRMGGALKPVPSEKKGLSKLPTAVRNKMGYMMGGGKLDMMYGKGGKLDMMYQKGGKMDVHDPKGLAHVGSKGAKSPLPTPYNKTKDNNSYISNDVDMSPSIKKQMMALRQAMMYFTGISPKNK
jgi:hypothetical protein